MSNVTITSAVRSGTKVTVKGTAAGSPVTVRLLQNGAVVATKDVTPDSSGNWEADFDPAPAANRARASVPGGKDHEVPIVSYMNPEMLCHLGDFLERPLMRERTLPRSVWK